MRTVEVISKPYMISILKDDEKVIEITITSVGDAGELTQAVLEEATRTILRGARKAEDVIPGDMGIDLEVLSRLYREGRGKVTDAYLAQLASVYSRLSNNGRRIWPALTEGTSIPLATLRSHLMRARNEGFLSETIQGRDGGDVTEKALRVLTSITDPGHRPESVSETPTLSPAVAPSL